MMAAPTSSTRRSDVKPLIIAAITAIAMGVVVAALILYATGRGNAPTKPAPFAAGLERTIRNDVKSGGPVFYPDPFRGYRSILFALEQGRLVALATHTWNRNNCTVQWRGTLDRFVDCDGNRLTSDQLPRYPYIVPSTGAAKGAALVDVRTLLPPPAPS
jgi:hypothetical protein